MIAFVLGVIAFSIFVGSILNVRISGSTKTNFAPTYVTANAVAIYVLDGTIQRDSSARIIRDGIVVHEGKLASSQLIFNAFNASINASNPLPTPIQ